MGYFFEINLKKVVFISLHTTLCVVIYIHRQGHGKERGKSKMAESRFVNGGSGWDVLYIDHEEKVFYYESLEEITENFNLELTNEYIENAEDAWLQDVAEYIDYLESQGYKQEEL